AHDEREPMLAIDRLENVHDAAGERGIEAGGGFVGQNDRGPLGEGARDGHTLLLAARERVGAAAGEVYQLHLCEARARELAGGGLNEPVERAEERGLAGAAPAEHHDELTLTDDEVDPAQRNRRRRQDDAEPRDLDHVRRSGRTQRGRTPSSSIAARTGSYSR